MILRGALCTDAIAQGDTELTDVDLAVWLDSAVAPTQDRADVEQNVRHLSDTIARGSQSVSTPFFDRCNLMISSGLGRNHQNGSVICTLTNKCTMFQTAPNAFSFDQSCIF